jgi:histidine decarboxylase
MREALRVGAQRPAESQDLDLLLRQLADDRKMQIGFPAAMDFDYSELATFLCHLLNNVGDPEVDPMFRGHTKRFEREVVEFFADLFRAPGDDRWGYVTSGGTESNLYALYLARSLFPNGLVYYSDAAHYSVPKAVDVLGMQAVRVQTTAAGVVDYGDLRNVIAQHRDKPAIVVANIGTTMTEAVDDIGCIKTVLRELSIGRHFIHSDAALSGIPLALLDIRPRFDLGDGADSVAISGHKFIGMPFPCGVVVTRRSLMRRLSQPVAYTGSPDATLGGSRSGHAALFLWYAIRRHGLSGWRQRAERARQLAEYSHRRLIELGWEAWRNPSSFTVVIKTPSRRLARRWMLATNDDGWSHIICMPGVTQDQIDRFIAELASIEGLLPGSATYSTEPDGLAS